MTSIREPQLFTRLACAKTVIVAGAGGGFDIFAGLPIAMALKAAGKQVQLIEGANYNHFDMCDSLANPYGPNGRAALKLMGLSAS